MTLLPASAAAAAAATTAAAGRAAATKWTDQPEQRQLRQDCCDPPIAYDAARSIPSIWRRDFSWRCGQVTYPFTGLHGGRRPRCRSVEPRQSHRQDRCAFASYLFPVLNTRAPPSARRVCGSRTTAPHYHVIRRVPAAAAAITVTSSEDVARSKTDDVIAATTRLWIRYIIRLTPLSLAIRLNQTKLLYVQRC